MTFHLMLRLFASLSALLLIVMVARSESPVRDHDIVIDDYFTQAFVTNVVMSPDGRYVAYTEMRWQGDKEPRNTDLWVVRTADGQTQRLTFDKTGDRGPQWSPDSRWIYFRSSPDRGEEAEVPYNGDTQVWRISVEGGEPTAITRVKDGIGGFEITRDGKALYYTVSSDGYEDEWSELRKKHDDVNYGHGKNEYTKLMRLDLVSWRTREVYAEDRHIVDFSASPNEERIALVTRPTEHLISNEGWSTVDILNMETEAITSLPDQLWRAQAATPYGWLEGLSWSADGRKLAFRCDYDGYPAELFVAHFSADDVRVRKLNRPGEFSLGSSPRMIWKGSSHDLCLLAIDHARVRVTCIHNIMPDGQGKTTILTPGDVVVDYFSLSEDGSRLAVTKADPRSPSDIYTLRANGRDDYQQLTKINPQIDRWKIPQTSLVQWTAPDGQQVEGVLELPPDYQPGKPLPMLVLVHGGPTSSVYYKFRFWFYGRTQWAAQGWAVLSPNYRGSTGYGDQFMTDLIGRENDIEVRDILSGVDAMVERGIADPERLAVAGWSNGGYLTNCLITHTDRFKAASSGAGVLDMMMQWGTEDTPGHVINYMRGLPWEAQDAYLTASPSWNLDKISTPTIIHVGKDDPRVPVTHSIMLHRALKEYLHVPSELLMYPGQGHGLTLKHFRKAKIEWDAAWFKRYVLGEEADPPDEPAQ